MEEIRTVEAALLSESSTDFKDEPLTLTTQWTLADKKIQVTQPCDVGIVSGDLIVYNRVKGNSSASYQQLDLGGDEIVVRVVDLDDSDLVSADTLLFIAPASDLIYGFSLQVSTTNNNQVLVRVLEPRTMRYDNDVLSGFDFEDTSTTFEYKINYLWSHFSHDDDIKLSVLEEDPCRIPTIDTTWRTAQGGSGISEQNCYGLGMCWDDSVLNAPSCFAPSVENQTDSYNNDYHSIFMTLTNVAVSRISDSYTNGMSPFCPLPSLDNSVQKPSFRAEFKDAHTLTLDILTASRSSNISANSAEDITHYVVETSRGCYAISDDSLDKNMGNIYIKVIAIMK